MTANVQSLSIHSSINNAAQETPVSISHEEFMRRAAMVPVDDEPSTEKERRICEEMDRVRSMSTSTEDFLDRLDTVSHEEVKRKYGIE